MTWNCGSRSQPILDAVFSSLRITGKNRDPEVLDFLVRTHDQLLAADLEDWPISDLTLGIGGTAGEPAVSYVVELGDPEEDDDAGTVPVPLEQNRQEVRTAVAAWTAGLGDLDALLQARLRPGYAARLTFAAPKFKPRLVVEELDSGDEDEDETAELVAAVRFHNPASKVKA